MLEKVSNTLMGWLIGGDTDAFKMLVNKRELAILWNPGDLVSSSWLKTL